MSDLVRLSFSIENTLYEKLSDLIKESDYNNRSEFIRDLIRNALVQKEWTEDEEAAGTITLIYDHAKRQLSEKLTKLQHHHHEEVLVTTHVHLDEHICAEMILIRGKASQMQKIFDTIRQQKGVLHASLSLNSLGKKLS